MSTISVDLDLRKLIFEAEVFISAQAAVSPEGESNLHADMKAWLDRANEVLNPFLSTDRKRFLSDVVITASYAVTYWADIEEYNPNEFEASFNLRELESGGEFHTFDISGVAKGIGLILDGTCQVNDSILGWVAEDNADNDASNIDSIAADAIVQAAIFGKLIYG